jgi:Skp family chaperone for outer membrane proteins
MRAKVLAAFVFIVSGCATTASQVAVVDMNRAVRECRDGQAARADLMKTFRSSQATLDKRQEDLYLRMQVFKQYRARNLDPPEDETAIKREIVALEALYRQLQQQLTEEENRRAAIIRARLDETLKQLKAERRIDKISIVSSVPAGDTRTIDLTSDLIRSADAGPPLAPKPLPPSHD